MIMKKKYLILASFAVLVIVLIFIRNSGVTSNPKSVYSFSINIMNYSQERGKPDYQISLKSVNDSVNVYAVNFTSRQFMNYSTRIFGLVFMPDMASNSPGVVFLPGGGMIKEQRVDLGIALARQGYSVLIIDQRGVGQTGGYYLSLQDDFEAFARGYEPIQHLSVYDCLRAFDVLASIDGVDKNNIAIAGESMGGRYAIIAAALDSRIKGLVAISSSGFHFSQNVSDPASNYLVSIDPDHYIGMIKPRYVFMLQGDNDSVVKMQDAEYTYSLAGEPKSFFIAQGCSHGYCDKMQAELYKDLKTIFSSS